MLRSFSWSTCRFRNDGGLPIIYWLVVEPYPSEKYESQLGWWFPIYGKRKHVPNHQAVYQWIGFHGKIEAGKSQNLNGKIYGFRLRFSFSTNPLNIQLNIAIYMLPMLVDSQFIYLYPTYSLVICYSLLLKIADFVLWFTELKRWWFSSSLR